MEEGSFFGLHLWSCVAYILVSILTCNVNAFRIIEAANSQTNSVELRRVYRVIAASGRTKYVRLSLHALHACSSVIILIHISVCEHVFVYV